MVITSGKREARAGWRLSSAAMLLALALPMQGAAETRQMESSAGPLRIETIATGFDTPWSIGFLPDGSFLVTELDGRLLVIREGKAQEVAGLPEIEVIRQGGLMDVLLPRDFPESRAVYLSFALEKDGGVATAMGRGRLSEDGARLEDFRILYSGDAVEGGRHFGGRLVEAADGSLFLTIGDRGTGPEGQDAQEAARAIGKVIHLSRDGAPLAAPEGWGAGFWSRGHRNPQGATLDLEGALLTVEHGAKGGDEINAPRQGRNYGWPVISYGVDYSGAKIGTGTSAEGMEQPRHYWDPSIAPSGLMVYSGKLLPAWKGDVFTGSLKSDFISRLDPETKAATGWSEERLTSPETSRVRDVREAPDGSIWFISETLGTIFRLSPAK